MRKLLLFIILFLSACGPQPMENVSVDNTLRREVDREAGVVCWQTSAYNLDCMPIEETKLEVAE